MVDLFKICIMYLNNPMVEFSFNLLCVLVLFKGIHLMIKILNVCVSSCAFSEEKEKEKEKEIELHYILNGEKVYKRGKKDDEGLCSDSESRSDKKYEG